MPFFSCCSARRSPVPPIDTTDALPTANRRGSIQVPSAPPSPSAAQASRVNAAASQPTVDVPAGTLTFRAHARPSNAPRTATMHRDSDSDDDEPVITKKLHEQLICHERCCTAVMCCVVGSFAAFIAYHQGVSYGQREIAPRCQHDLNNCRLSLSNFTKPYKKN